MREALRTVSDVSVLHIAVMAPLGRDLSLSFDTEVTDVTSEFLALSTDDFDLLTRIEAPEPMGLWRFATAIGTLRARSRVLSFSAIDDYAIYRKNNFSFYLSDNRLPTQMLMTPGSGGALRIRERQRFDQHAARLPRSNKVVDVVRWPADDATPVYRPDDPKLSSLYVVEIGKPCWVVPAGNSEDEEEPSADLAEAVAFWLWRCRELVRLALDRLELQSLVVETRFMTYDLNRTVRPEIEPMSAWVTCDLAEGGDGIILTLLEGARDRMASSDNAAERAIAGLLVSKILELAGIDDGPKAGKIASSLPAGPMRMMHVFGQEDDLTFSFPMTGPPRLVSSPNVETVLDEVGVIASQIAKSGEGVIAAEDRTRVLNGVVGELFTRMRELLLELKPKGLLELIASEQESLIFLESRNRLLIPSQAACFGDDSSAVQRAITSARDVTKTSVANRFLIEFVTAISPSGTEPLSVGPYDELIALASEIVQFGYLSDAIQYDLSSTELALLPSGRLGVSRDEPYQQAVETYTSRIAGNALERARALFSSHWGHAETGESPYDPTRLNEAFEAEFGVTAREVVELTGDLAQIAGGVEGQTTVRRLDELIDLLQAREPRTESRLRAALDLLSLGPLNEFPPLENRADSYPWRFSRDRSAARRPLLLRGEGHDIEAVWGPRAVLRSGRYLLDLLNTDRLNARSQIMKRFITESRQAANREFQHQVAGIFREATPKVLENVTRIGKLRLVRESGEDIGDIDVFAIDETRKVIVAVEVKDFELARTPAELSNEMKKLLDGPKSAVHHHTERLAFLKSHREDVHRELRLPGSASEWQIHGEIVTSHDLLAAHFPLARSKSKAMNLVCFHDLAERSKRGQLIRRTPNSTSKRKRRKQSR